MEKVIISPEKEFLILSLKHTNKKDKYITLWRPDNKGYCWMIDAAGRYKGYQKGYHDSPENIPVPLSMIPFEFIVEDSDGRDCIKNCKASVKYFESLSLNVFN